MKALLLALIALALAEWYLRRPSAPQMVGDGPMWLEHCRNGGGA